MVTILVALVLVSCSGNRAADGGQATGSPPSGVARAALQPEDVPGDVERCPYSAPMPRYIENIRRLDEGAHASTLEAWDKFKAAGAVDGYVAVFARTPRVCQYWITGPPMNHEHGAMRVASSIVLRFKDVAGAEAAYKADLFGQSKLNGSDGAQVDIGPATGLGPNSVAWFEEMPNSTAAQVVWQAGPFNVFVATRNLGRDEVDEATSAVNVRSLGATP